ncbi:hypothetical protein FO519_005394 [Halicephalobus sp. NKZ332]|nr:hypothetical protein FO519_005394 [Halicephalobus sp. NKZ332]
MTNSMGRDVNIKNVPEVILVRTEDTVSPYNTDGSAIVSPVRFSGSLCESRVPTACSNKSCENGICRILENSEAFCDCFYGFSGEFCNEKTNCDETSCSGHGTCESLEIDVKEEKNYLCKCEEGWTGSRCEIDVDECLENPCTNNGRCKNFPGGFHCECPIGFVGEKCERKHFGGCSRNPCQNEGNCINKFNPTSKRTFSCECPDGFKGDLCQERINFCEPYFDEKQGLNISRCNNGGVCINQYEGYSCLCPPGFTGPDCLLNINECEVYGSSLCQNGGSCLDTYGSFQCSCVVGFSGEHCETDEDDCENNHCFEGSKCIDKIRRYECECAEDRIGIYCQFENPCFGGKNKCKNGKCFSESSTGNFSCLCEKGFSGEFCDEDIDECEEKHPSRCYKGKCINTEGSYLCQCDPGYEGPNCDKQVDECDPNPCQNSATCLDKIADYECVCMQGWEGKNCEIPQKYSPNCTKTICLHDGICQKDVYGEESCVCQTRFTGPSCGEYKQNPCYLNHCKNKATCTPTHDYSSFTCECKKGYSGLYCEKSTDSCDDDPCMNGECISTDSGYQCLCEPGFKGTNCETNIDDCKKNPCGVGICVDEVDSYKCKCPSTHTGKDCEILIDNPCQTSPCFNNGSCLALDIQGKYECFCENNFSGRNCEIDLSDCKDKCQNGGHCKHGKCACQNGFSGDFCEKDMDYCNHKSPKCQHSGVCENLENDFYCRCGDGHTGRFCEKKVNVTEYRSIKKNEEELCLSRNCSTLAGNGYCDEYCNLAGCNFDGGDCSAKNPRPFEKCPYEEYCTYVFKNDKCDEICNIEECLFDGLDCKEKPSTKCPEFDYCSKKYGNGICDRRCNMAACGWDGGDCYKKKNEKDERKFILQESLVLVLETNEENFIKTIAPKFLMMTSQILRATAHYEMDSEGNPMIYRWNSRSGQGPRINILEGFEEDEPEELLKIVKREVPEKSGVIVYLLLDVSVCYHLQELSTHFKIEMTVPSGIKHCFTETRMAANMLAAESTKDVFHDLGIEIAESRIAPREYEKESGTPLILIILLMAAMFTIVIFGGVQFTKKRKIVKITETFYPPPEALVNKQRNFSNQFGFYNGEQPLMGDISGYTSMTNSNRNSTRSNPDDFEKKNLNGKMFTILHQLASTAEPIKEEDLKKYEQFITTVDSEDRTCIHWSVESVDSKTNEAVINDIRNLMMYGCDVNAQDVKGKTALHMAIMKKRTEVALFLLSLNNIEADVEDENGCTPLFDAVVTESLEIVEKILEKEGIKVNICAFVNDTPLIKCARIGDRTIKIVEKLLSYPGIDINKVGDKNDQNYNGKTALHDAAACDSIEIMNLLIKKKANVGALDFYNRTPLFLAVESGQLKAVNVLLQNMSRDSILCANDQEVTPLHVAREKHFTEIASILEKYTNTVPHQMPCWENQMIPNYQMNVRNIESIIPGKSAARNGRKRRNDEPIENNLQSYNTEGGNLQGYHVEGGNMKNYKVEGTNLNGNGFVHQPSPPYQLVHSQSPHTTDSYCSPSPNETVLSNHNSTHSSSDSGSFASTPRSQESHVNYAYQDNPNQVLVGPQNYAQQDFQNYNPQVFQNPNFYNYQQPNYNNYFNPYDHYQEMFSQRVPFCHQYYYNNPAQKLMYPPPMNPNILNRSNSNHTLNVRE